MKATRKLRQRCRQAFSSAVCNWPSFSADQGRSVALQIGKETFPAYSFIDESYFPYTRELSAVKRKIFSQNKNEAWKKVMEVKAQKERLFVGVPKPVQHDRIGSRALVAAADDNVGSQRRNNEGRSSDRDRLEAQSARLNAILANLSPAERLARFRREVDGKLVFTTSLGLEDQVILHLLAEQEVDVEIVTLDTGRLFSQTYELWAETERRYRRRIRAFYPRRERLESLIGQHGINGFYDSREARSACCGIRKVEPLNRALDGATGWIVGLRADQSEHRRGAALLTVDERNLFKLSPLFDWTRAAVLSFAFANQVPINPLHDQGFASIGCAPCTRAIAPGEPERAGRWWWEQNDNKECGLHARR